MPPMQYRHPPERYTLRGGVSETRVLIAFEDEYRTYREFMASAVRTHRPHIEVVAAGLGGRGEEVARFDPPPGNLQPAQYRRSRRQASLGRAPSGPRAVGRDLPRW
jgi:hypothetical protein